MADFSWLMYSILILVVGPFILIILLPVIVGGCLVVGGVGQLLEQLIRWIFKEKPESKRLREESEREKERRRSQEKIKEEISPDEYRRRREQSERDKQAYAEYCERKRDMSKSVGEYAYYHNKALRYKTHKKD